MSTPPPPASEASQVHPDLKRMLPLAPGETNISGNKFTPSLLTPYLRGAMAVTNTRIVYRLPTTFLSFIPAGTMSNAIPLRNVASVTTSTRLRPASLFFGFVGVLAGLFLMSQNVVLGLIFLLLGAPLLASSFPARLEIMNSGGGSQSLTVSTLEKNKLAAFAEEINARVFADNDALRHQDSMAMAQMQAMLQAQMLSNQQNAAGQQMPPQQMPQQMPPQQQSQQQLPQQNPPQQLPPQQPPAHPPQG